MSGLADEQKMWARFIDRITHGALRHNSPNGVERRRTVEKMG